jgi:hypothetical protein
VSEYYLINQATEHDNVAVMHYIREVGLHGSNLGRIIGYLEVSLFFVLPGEFRAN